MSKFQESRDAQIANFSARSKHDIDAERVQASIAEYLARGGQIHEIESHHSDMPQMSVGVHNAY